MRGAPGLFKTVLMVSVAWLGLLDFAGYGQEQQPRRDATIKRTTAVPGSVARDRILSEGESSTLTTGSPLKYVKPESINLNIIPERLGKEVGAGEKASKPLEDVTMGVVSERWGAQLPGVLAMAGLTFLPAALLMTTSFVRIQITLSLLRQALGSPTIPGNQVIVALSLLLTALIMRPVGDDIYTNAVEPYMNGKMSQVEAIRVGVGPLQKFMVAQIYRTGHEAYLEELAVYAREQESRGAGKKDVQKSSGIGQANDVKSVEEIPLHVVAPAFLLSELTTALLIGFSVYLPFMIVDLVVATILAAMGLWMMPPSLISTPAKLVLFVLADGWMLTAGALLNGFATA